jgi:alpha-tubulin suppressor-like RCC1 family protein
VAISAGWNHTVGLRSDGTVVAVGSNGDGQCNVSKWHLFNNINTIEEERKKEVRQYRIEQERLALERKARKEKLLSEQNALQAELPTLKGLFAGKRRKEIQQRLEKIKKELQGLK